ncbi:MAG: VTT domain-containing protein [Candidatus Liptonbacteria bacterium]
MKRRVLNYLSRTVLISCLLGISAVFYFSSPDKIISYIGAENGYIIIFILALVGGLTTFSGVPYHLVLISLASGGLNPLLLGVITGVGVILGDSTSYYIGYGGREIIPEKIRSYLNKLFLFGSRYPRTMPIFFLLYGSMIPLSNDFIVISAGLARYPFKKVMIPLAMGNLIFNISLAYFGSYSYLLIQRLFS